jgi:3-mercaptopyruvate sulfurtransferase SseA/sterol desaturase/sphingolipid hydroxylase (fatty acid hydroxylase superfamily)
MMNYLVWLAAFSVLVAVFERLWPARPQKTLRRWLWSDALHLVFNGHVLGLLLYGITWYRVLPVLDAWLADQGWTGLVYRNAASGWSLVVQSVVALVVLDFVQWLVHNSLHRSGLLWRIHQVHHSVKDGEMDWIVSFRFSWLEPVYYKAAMYLPAMWFGFAPEAMFFHAVFGTLIGHLNHANLTWDYGPLRYLFNSPRMHLYHHDWDAPAHGQNFGITLSVWDWIFGTAHLPDDPPARIGFPGVEKLPEDFFGQLIWPLPLLSGRLQGTRVAASVAGVAVLGGLYGLSLPPAVDTPMFGEPAASSQPAMAAGGVPVDHAATPEEADAALQRFGEAATAAGWAAPEAAVTARELAEALGSERLVVLDVRTAERFEAGHVPSAQLVTRGDYSGGDIPGVSRDRATLQAMLRARGVDEGAVVVVMGDGGPEPYRLWWTLHQVGGVQVRVLDGGLASWKALGERLAEGPGRDVPPGDIRLGEGPGRNLMWADVQAVQAATPGLQLVDTRGAPEFTGEKQHAKAPRAGHIPGARHLDWKAVLRLEGDAPVLRDPADARAVFAEAGIDPAAPILTYCQSGTRSAAVYYSLLQLGADVGQVWNYDGSWAEYSRLADLPVASGETG